MPRRPFFPSEHVGELRIIVLSRRKRGNKCTRTKRQHMCKHTLTHTTHTTRLRTGNHITTVGLHRIEPSQSTTKLHLSLPDK
jgi:hypothetical protein